MAAAEEEKISVEDEAVDKNIFKDCNKIAFYRRQKQWFSKKSPYQASLDSVRTGKDSTRFCIINEANKCCSGQVSGAEPIRSGCLQSKKSHRIFKGRLTGSQHQEACGSEGN